MTALAKLEANRTNGKHSTGPKTANGKAAAKMNAVSHGLRSLSPVLPDERLKDWNDHRKGIVAALTPVGTLEAELAERVALLTWRLRRVVRYETAVTSADISDAVADIRGENDDDNPLRALFSSPLPKPRTYATVRKELEQPARTRLGARRRGTNSASSAICPPIIRSLGVMRSTCCCKSVDIVPSGRADCQRFKRAKKRLSGRCRAANRLRRA